MSEVKTAVILAAGLGSRLKDRTKEKPKAFLQIGGKSLIERSIDNLIEQGITKIIIGTGYLNEYFDALKDQYPMIVTHRNDDFAQTGSMYTLYNLRHLIDEPFLLLEADLLYEKNALISILQTGKPDVILASGQTHSNDEVYIEANANSDLVNMSKQVSELQHISGELVGISKVSEKTFGAMCDYANARYDTGDRSFHYEDDFVGIADNIPIHILKIDDLVWCEIDDEQHLQRAQQKVFPIIKQRDHL